MKINEVFDSAYAWEWTRNNDNLWVAEFRTKSGDELFVDFSKISNNGWDGGFARNDLTKVTGEGDQFKIFATAVEVFKEFIEAHPDINFLVFTAYKTTNELGKARNKTTRENLYKRMVKTLASQHNLDYEIKDGEQKTTFKLIPKKPLNEVSRPQTQEDADKILQDAGYNRIGFGAFGAVYEKEGSNKVIKTFSSIDTSYIKFIKMVKKSNYNPHFPVFYGNPLKITDTYYGIKQEKLKPYNGNPSAISKYVHYLATNYKSKDPDWMEEIEDIIYEYPRFKEACKMLADLMKNNSNIRNDIVKHNIMKRGNTIVFVDPVANAHYSKDELNSLPNIGTWSKSKKEKSKNNKKWSKEDQEILDQLYSGGK